MPAALASDRTAEKRVGHIAVTLRPNNRTTSIDRGVGGGAHMCAALFHDQRVDLALERVGDSAKGPQPHSHLGDEHLVDRRARAVGFAGQAAHGEAECTPASIDGGGDALTQCGALSVVAGTNARRRGRD